MSKDAIKVLAKALIWLLDEYGHNKDNEYTLSLKSVGAKKTGDCYSLSKAKEFIEEINNAVDISGESADKADPLETDER